MTLTRSRYEQKTATGVCFNLLNQKKKGEKNKQCTKDKNRRVVV